MKTVITWVILLAIGFAGYGYWRHSNPRTVTVHRLQATTAAPPAGSSYLPEQRRKFALDFARKNAVRYRDMTITTTGDFHATLLMKGRTIDEQFALEMKNNSEAVREFREMGFRHLVVTDGKTAWDIDLKN